ncbi:LapA family protein [Clostridium sp. KNHs214]|uniref:LapA family protein n=1 Tax=Clostridium sp. KNHs214 TaxID=1540257 RepID=UPI000690DDF8|nr:LapA family protein [Clostridium sp. KNHs214]
MRNTFIVWLIFALLVTIFTIQNATVITVKLFMWQFNISLAVIILLCIIIGAVVGTLLGLKKEMNLKKENKKLTNEVVSLEEKIKDIKYNKEVATCSEKFEDSSTDKESKSSCNEKNNINSRN